MYIKQNGQLYQKIRILNEELIIPIETFDFNNIDYTEIANLANDRLITYIANKQNIEIPIEILESLFVIELKRYLKYRGNK